MLYNILKMGLVETLEQIKETQTAVRTRGARRAQKQAERARKKAELDISNEEFRKKEKANEAKQLKALVFLDQSGIFELAKKVAGADSSHKYTMGISDPYRVEFVNGDVGVRFDLGWVVKRPIGEVSTIEGMRIFFSSEGNIILDYGLEGSGENITMSLQLSDWQHAENKSEMFESLLEIGYTNPMLYKPGNLPGFSFKKNKLFPPEKTTEQHH
jgi:hypothetical protein